MEEVYKDLIDSLTKVVFELTSVFHAFESDTPYCKKVFIFLYFGAFTMKKLWLKCIFGTKWEHLRTTPLSHKINKHHRRYCQWIK